MDQPQPRSPDGNRVVADLHCSLPVAGGPYLPRGFKHDLRTSASHGESIDWSLTADFAAEPERLLEMTRSCAWPRSGGHGRGYTASGGQNLAIGTGVFDGKPAEADQPRAEHNQWDLGVNFKSPIIWLWGNAATNKSLSTFPMITPDHTSLARPQLNHVRYHI